MPHARRPAPLHEHGDFSDRRDLDVTAPPTLVPAQAQSSVMAHPDRSLWCLSTPATCMILGADEAGALTQRYWGPALPATDMAQFGDVDRLRWTSTFQSPGEIEEQLPFDGGHRWGVPSLQVVFDGGVRALELAFAGADTVEYEDGHGLLVRLVDEGFGFGAALHYRVRHGTDVIERWVELRNGHSKDVRVLRADSGSWLMPDQDEYRISSVHGHWSGETQLERRTLPTGEYTLTSRHGTTGQQSNPWVMVDDGTATEEFGTVRTVALAWSGSWRLTAQRRPDGAASVTAGFGHDGLEWSLHPGDALTTPSSLGLHSEGGFGAASRSWHDYVRRHVLTHPQEDRPVLFNSWEATEFDISLEGQIALARKAADLGVELFVVDDGWFGSRTHDAAGLGDWFPNPDRFPEGLHPLVDTVRTLGMGFGIWVEPEMVNPDSDLYRANPDWVLHWPGRRRDELRNQLVLNFGRTDVRQWALRSLDDLAGAYSLDFLKWDMNRPFTQAGWPDRADNHDMVWIEHTRGVYSVMDELRRRHPGLRIEACSSGGGRVDLAIMSRTDQVWTSDNTDSLDRQTIQHGYSQLYPAVTMGAWVTEEVNALTGRRVPLDYRFHVAMAGALGIGGDLDLWSPDELDRSREHIARYKAIRSTVQHGDLYRLGQAPGRDYSALEYVADRQVVLLSYDPHRSLSRAPRRLRLRGLDPAARYRDTETGTEYSGAVLMGRGLLFNEHQTLRGWNNTRFSAADYASSLLVLERLAG